MVSWRACWLVVAVGGCAEPPLQTSAHLTVEHQIWVADRGADRVLAFDASGQLESTIVDDVIGPSSVRIGPDGAIYIASFGEAAVVRLDPDTGSHAHFYDDSTLEEPVELLFVDGALCVLGNDTRNALLLDQGGTLLQEIHPLAKDAHDFAVSPDGLLYVASGAQPGTGTIEVWDVAARRSLYTFGHELDNAMSLAFADDGTLYAADYATSRILRYDLVSREVLEVIEAERPVSIDFGPDGRLYVIDDRGVSAEDDVIIPSSVLERPRSLTFVQ